MPSRSPSAAARVAQEEQCAPGVQAARLNVKSQGGRTGAPFRMTRPADGDARTSRRSLLESRDFGYPPAAARAGSDPPQASGGITQFRSAQRRRNRALAESPVWPGSAELSGRAGRAKGSGREGGGKGRRAWEVSRDFGPADHGPALVGHRFTWRRRANRHSSKSRRWGPKFLRCLPSPDILTGGYLRDAAKRPSVRCGLPMWQGYAGLLTELISCMCKHSNTCENFYGCPWTFELGATAGYL